MNSILEFTANDCPLADGQFIVILRPTTVRRLMDSLL